MSDKTITDSTYGLIEELENRKKWVLVIMVTCFVVAPMGLGLEAFSIMILLHQKGGESSINILFIAMSAFVCISILAIGMKKYFLFKKWEKGLGQLEQLERTICQEVLSRQRN